MLSDSVWQKVNYRIHNDEMIIYCVAKWGVVDIYCKKKTTKGNKNDYSPSPNKGMLLEQQN